MKKFPYISSLFFIISLHFNIHSQINQDWKWVHPKPQGNTITYIKAFSETDWIAVGNLGTFMRTTNAGESWELYTHAGGINSAMLNRNLLSAWFFNMTSGIVCGAEGYIAKTTNGGYSWDAITSGVTSSLTGVHFINSTTGFISSAINILKTTDAGSSWMTIRFDSTANGNNIFALDENHIYIASGGGLVFASANGGANWSKYSTGPGIFNDINFITPTTGIVCGTNGIVKKTTNGGINWTNINIGVSMNLFQLYVESQVSGSPYTENFDNTLFPPAGWTAINALGDSVQWNRSTLQSFSIPASAFINYDCDSSGGSDWLISPKILINNGDSLIFRLRLLNTGSDTDSLCVRVSATDSLTSSFTERILYLSDGNNYPDSAEWRRYSVSLDTFAGQNIFIGFKYQNYCGNGLFLDNIYIGGTENVTASLYVVGDTTRLFKTENFGAEWMQISLLDTNHKYINTWNTMDIYDSLIIVAGPGGAINVSTNFGEEWSEVNIKLAAGTVLDIWCDYGTGNIWTVGSQGKINVIDQVLHSSNGGVTFENQNAGNNPAIYRSIDMINSNTGYICGNLANIRKTTNGGSTWDSLVTPIPHGNILVKIDFVNENTGWVFSNTSNPAGSIWHTTDGGESWTRQGLVDSTINGYRINTAKMLNENLGFCANNLSAIHMTTNGGDNWFLRAPSVFTNSQINEINMVDENTGYFCGTTKLFRTTDQFFSYDSIPHPLPGNIVSTKWIDENNGFITSSTGLTAKTTNGGEVWEIMQTSASSLNTIFLKTIDTAYAGGINGSVFKLEKGLVNISWKNIVPSEFFLGQNYPNPFNPVTEFKFGLGLKGNVNLKLFDINGRLVHTFFDNVQLSAGTLTVKYDASQLASGVYFYTLIVDNKMIETRKMVLLK